MPVYIIQAKRGEPVLAKRLVRAHSKSQAIRYVAESMLACDVAKAETVADMMRVGFQCEDARAPETAELPLSPPPIESATSTVENLDALDRVLDEANRIDQVAIKEIDNVF